MARLLSNLMLSIGISLIIFSLYLFFLRLSPNRLKFDNFEAPPVINQESYPKAIIINSADIKAKMVNSEIKSSGEWEAARDSASYLISSPPPGSIGNTIIYGHNYNSIFGNLKDVKKGDSIQIVMDTDQIIKYTVDEVKEVNPADVSVLKNTNDSRLTIYTCSGFLDSKRLVVVAISNQII